MGTTFPCAISLLRRGLGTFPMDAQSMCPIGQHARQEELEPASPRLYSPARLSSKIRETAVLN